MCSKNFSRILEGLLNRDGVRCSAQREGPERQSRRPSGRTFYCGLPFRAINMLGINMLGKIFQWINNSTKELRMKHTILACTIATFLFISLGLPVQVAAQHTR